MNRSIVQSSEPILLVGGGTSNPDVLNALLADCRRHVAADSGADTLLRHGSDEQKRRYLPEIASGALRLQSMAVTEPTTSKAAKLTPRIKFLIRK